MSSLFDPVVEQEAVRLGAWYLEKVEGVEALEHPSTTPSPSPTGADLAASRHGPRGAAGRSTSATGFDVGDVDPDPFVQVRRWMEEWAAVAPNEPDAVVLATADADGRPSARTVLLRGFDERGCTVFTSYDSRKGQRPRRQPARRARCAAGCPLLRQVHLRGPMAQVSRAESEAYFAGPAPREPAGGLGVAPVERARRPGRARGPLRRRPSAGSGTARCRARRTGAATGWSPTRSSCGRAAPTGCTTACATSADATTVRPAGGSSASARRRGSGPAGRGRGEGADERHLVGDRLVRRGGRPTSGRCATGCEAAARAARRRGEAGSRGCDRCTPRRSVGMPLELVDHLVARHARRAGGRRRGRRGARCRPPSSSVVHRPSRP